MPDLSERDHQRMFWMTKYLELPEQGVEVVFPSTISCARRLAAVRWPDGPKCMTCGGDDIGYLAVRKLYHCRNCRRQMSVTSGTVAHRSRLDLQLWFRAAQDVIAAHALGDEDSRLTGHGEIWLKVGDGP